MLLDDVKVRPRPLTDPVSTPTPSRVPEPAQHRHPQLARYPRDLDISPATPSTTYTRSQTSIQRKGHIYVELAAPSGPSVRSTRPDSLPDHQGRRGGVDHFTSRFPYRVRAHFECLNAVGSPQATSTTSGSGLSVFICDRIHGKERLCPMATSLAGPRALHRTSLYRSKCGPSRSDAGRI